ncbi:type II toxin-antitoxin system RelE/ParE family toxin [bacterium]|nr:type II toxin-antitoxin system RelE/ParE family toxin [bacterium]
MKITASNHFIRFKKKANKNLQLEIDEQVKAILENPEIGELKKGGDPQHGSGGLRGIRVHKFNFKSQLYLVSYEVTGETLLNNADDGTTDSTDEHGFDEGLFLFSIREIRG